MSFDDDEEYSDEDEAFDEDMEALRRACLLTGANPDATSALSDVDDSDDDDDDDGEDDMEMVRKLRERFSDYANLEGSLSLTPLWSVPPPDSDNEDDVDGEDDFEALKSIRRRFGAYNEGGVKENTEDSIERTEQVGVTNKIALEKEASNNLFVKTNNNAEEGFPNCVDTNNIATQNLGVCSDPVTSEFVGACSEHVSSELVEWQDSGARKVPTFPLKTSGLSKSALAFFDAIKKNRSCQIAIRSKMMQVQVRIEEIKALMDRVKLLKGFQTKCKVKTGRALAQKNDPRVQLISQAKQRSSSKSNDKKTPAMSYGPPENSHVAIYKEVLTNFPSTVTRERWSKEEKKKLKKGVEQQFQKKLFQQSVDMCNDTEESSIERRNIDMIVATITDWVITPQHMRYFLPKINWEELASEHVPSRSGLECQSRWLNCVDPLINWNPWTSMEEKNLLHIIQQKGPSNWIDIAVSLGTNRTPFWCLAHYQRSLNASIIRREWTKEEDIKIQAAVEEYGESNWQVVASLLEGRTGTQCSNRWMKSLHPARKRVGKWTPEEDKRLKVAVMIFGPKNWSKIAEFVPGRMQSQCRERWTNSLDPSLILGGWTSEEDLLLEEGILKHGYSWSKVASCVPHRTDNQCMRRWTMLFPEQVPLLRAAKKTKRAAMISNFVDRESERPAIGPHDFLQLPAIEPSPRLKKPPPRPKKSFRRRVRRTRKDNSSGDDTSEEEVLRLTNGTEGEDGQEAGTSATQVRRSSRQRKRKVITDYDGGDDDDCILTRDSVGKNKKQKLMSNKRSLPIPICENHDNLESLDICIDEQDYDDDDSVVARDSAGRNKRHKSKSNKKKNLPIPIYENPDNLEPLDVSIADYGIDDDSMVARDSAGRNKKQKPKANKKNLPIPLSENPDNLEPLDVSIADYGIEDDSMVARDSAGKNKKQKPKTKTKTNKKKNLPIPISENPDTLEPLDVSIADYGIDDDSMVARDSAGRNKKQKLKSNNKKDLPIPLCENPDTLEPLDVSLADYDIDDDSMVARDSAGRDKKQKLKSNKKKNLPVPVCENHDNLESIDFCIADDDDSLIDRDSTRTNKKQKLKSNKKNLPIQICENPDNLEFKDIGIASKRRKFKRRSKPVGEAWSLQNHEGEEDDGMTLASFLGRSCGAKRSSHSAEPPETVSAPEEVDSTAQVNENASAAEVSLPEGQKRSSTMEETSSGLMQAEDSGDDLPLSQFCKKLKDTHSHAEEDADNSTLSHFCKKLKDTRSNAEENADDSTLSHFCTRLKKRGKADKL